MSARPSALALRAALTFSCAVLVHGAVHAAGDRGFAWDSAAHVVLLAVALALLAGTAAALGAFAAPAERRRRLALVRAALPASGAAPLARGLALQAAIAGAIFGAEGRVLAPDRLALMALCGGIALALSALLFRRGARAVVDLLATAARPRDRRGAAPLLAPRAAHAAVVGADYRLFVPNRPPPLAA